MAAVGLLLAGPILRTFFVDETCSCLSTPRLPGLLVIGLAMLTGATWLQQMRGRPTPGWFRRLGGGLLVAAVASGLAHLIGEIAHFA